MDQALEEATEASHKTSAMVDYVELQKALVVADTLSSY